MTIKIEKIIENAYNQSINELRKGDTEEEIECIQHYLKSAEKIIIPTRNNAKVKSINQVLKKFGLINAKQLRIDTRAADLTRLPAISKAIMALDQCECDIVIARGRMGTPGSGSMMVIIDKKGRILSATTSPSHVVHKKELQDAVYDETIQVLERIGLKEYNDTI